MSNTFCIIPVGIDDGGIIKAVHEAASYFKNDVANLDFVDIPKGAYNKARNQYRATSFLRIAEKGTGNKNIVITNVDLYASRVNFVFGQAFLNGKACVVSTHRLDPQFYANDGGDCDLSSVDSNHKIFAERVKKEVIHEIGHTFGFRHCSDPECVMSFSSGIEEVDAKTSILCDNCRDISNQIPSL